MQRVVTGLVLAFLVAGLVSFAMTDLGAPPKLRLGCIFVAGLGTLVALSKLGGIESISL